MNFQIKVSGTKIGIEPYNEVLNCIRLAGREYEKRDFSTSVNTAVFKDFDGTKYILGNDCINGKNNFCGLRADEAMTVATEILKENMELLLDKDDLTNEEEFEYGE